MTFSPPSLKTVTAALRDFVSFESTHEHPEMKTECLDWIETAFLSKQLMTIQRDAVLREAPYLYRQHPDAQFLWFAHIDVVPGSKEQFSLTVEGDSAYGRGVKDMKGAALPFLMAYRDALDAGEDPPVSILMTSDEEVGGKTIPTLLKQGTVKTSVAFTPDTGSSPGIVVEHKGVVWAEIVATGKGGHSAMPWEADNPLFTLSKALTHLQKVFPPGSDADWHITVTPTMLQGSEARNQIPATATCGVDIRFPASICSSASDALKIVEGELSEGCTIREILHAHPLQTDDKHPLVLLIKELAEEVEGKTVDVRKEHGCTDARFFSELGIPAFLYGPEGGDLHGAREWVSLSSIIHQYILYRRLFEALQETDISL